MMEWPLREDIDKLGVFDHKKNEFKFGWLVRGAIDSMRFYKNDGTKSEKFGYNGDLGIDDKRWLTGCRKIRVGRMHGCISGCWFYDANGNDIAGGESTEWQTSEDDWDEIILTPN
jgi:hypothetical protein